MVPKHAWSRRFGGDTVFFSINPEIEGIFATTLKKVQKRILLSSTYGS
jgi:hypothetical protein